MPYFYALLTRHEWRTLVFASYGAFTLLGVVLTVSPLLENSDRVLLKELERRATAMARVIVESNIQAIQQQAEGKTGVLKSVDGAKGVRQALLVDLDSRIIAPPERYNQSLTEGTAAALARKAKRLFVEEGRTATVVSSADSRTVVAIEPMILFSPREGRNIPVAMAVVSIDAGTALAGFGEESVAYMEAMIIMGIVGAIIALLLYRLTLKPLQVLYEEMDRSLKGDRITLSRDLKFEELRQLQDMVETALQRVASSSSSSSGVGAQAQGEDAGVLGEDVVSSYRLLGEACSHAVAVCDAQRRALFLNSAFEDVTGIRFDAMETRPLQELARDQAFGVLLDDCFQRCSSGGGGVQESFEFSGVNFTVRMVPVPGSGLTPRGFVFLAQKAEGG
jgi:PAS domain-containing protein